MCNEFSQGRFSLTATATKRCDLGETHTVDTLTTRFSDPHALYRAVKSFYEKNEHNALDIRIQATASNP